MLKETAVEYEKSNYKESHEEDILKTFSGTLVE